MDTDTPDFRATVLPRGAIRLVDWGPWLASGGPLYTLLDARGRAGVAIADLTIVRDDAGVAAELVVDFCCGESLAARRALARWAAHVGYRRVWFDGEILELEPAPGGYAYTRCTGCAARLVDRGSAFWEYVRFRGAFPTACVLCGADLPQWKRPRRRAAGTAGPRSGQASPGDASWLEV